MNYDEILTNANKAGLQNIIGIIEGGALYRFAELIKDDHRKELLAASAKPVAVVVEFNDHGGTYELVSPPTYRPPIGAKLYTDAPDDIALFQQCLAAFETDDWQRKINASNALRKRLGISN